MRKTAMFDSKGHSVNHLLLLFFLPVTFLSLVMFPSVESYASWEPVGPDGGHFIFSMTNPANADEIIAITSSPSPSNVYKSTNGGASWSRIGEIPDPHIDDVSAFDFSTLYAISSARCYSSTDGGINWSEAELPTLSEHSRLSTSSGQPCCVCAHPTNSRIVYIAGYYSHYINNTRACNMVFFKSADGGQNWTTSKFFTFERLFLYDLVISESNPDVMYISGQKVGGDQNSGALFTTSDGGNTWTDISSAVDTERFVAFTSVAIDPTDDGKVYVGGRYFYRGTKTWRDTGLSWTRSSIPLYIDLIVYIDSICIDPVDPSRIYVGMYENVAASTNYGVSWNLRNNAVESSAGHIAVAPADPSKVYVSSYAGFYKSQDWGSSWNTSHEGIYADRINAMNVDTSMTLVQARGYLMSYGRGRNSVWEDVVTPESCGEVCDILINPDNPDTVLILEDYG